MSEIGTSMSEIKMPGSFSIQQGIRKIVLGIAEIQANGDCKLMSTMLILAFNILLNIKLEFPKGDMCA